MKLYDYINNGCLAGDYNCAEKILRGADAAYGLNLPCEALKLSAGFGSGMGVCNTCGVVTAGVMVLSHLFVRERGHESKLIGTVCAQYIKEFERAMTCTDCLTLRKLYRTPEDGCKKVILTAAMILDGVIERNKEHICVQIKPL